MVESCVLEWRKDELGLFSKILRCFNDVFIYLLIPSLVQIESIYSSGGMFGREKVKVSVSCISDSVREYRPLSYLYLRVKRC